jgi:hypothetical protein
MISLIPPTISTGNIHVPFKHAHNSALGAAWTDPTSGQCARLRILSDPVRNTINRGELAAIAHALETFAGRELFLQTKNAPS